MKAQFVFENLNEKFYDSDMEDNYDDSEVDVVPEDEDIEDEDTSAEDDIYVDNELETSLENELKVPEYARQPVSFRVKGNLDVIEAIPMAKTKDGAFLMRIDGKYRKFRLEDIIEESVKHKRDFNHVR